MLRTAATFALLGVLTGSSTALAAMTAPDAIPLIPRSVLFGNPDRAGLSLSPDGNRVAFLAPLDGVLNVWVAPTDDLEAAKPVTRDTGRGIRQFFWAYNNADLLYLQDKGGDENWKLYRIRLADGSIKDLTPFEEIPGPDGKPIMLPTGQPLRPTVQVVGVSHLHPGRILIGLNNRNPMFHDLYELDLESGAMRLLVQNDAWVAFMVDDDFTVRMGMRMNPDGSTDYFKASAGAPGADGRLALSFEPFLTIGQEDSLTTSPLGFSKDGQTLYLRDSRGRNTGALVAKDLGSGAIRVLAENAKADAGGALIHPTEKTVQAVSFEYLRDEWTIVDPAIEADFEYLRSVDPGDINVTSRSLDDRRWVVVFTGDRAPSRTYVYDRDARKATFVFSSRKALEGQPLQPMHPVVIRSRDGLDLVSYLTLPAGSDSDGDGRPDAAVPLVLNVHGGPWARDSWGLNPEAQWLANRGYATLQVNFRGSTGFGKEFLNAGNKEWAAKMHDDLIDAVQWAVQEGIADPKRVAIYGGSYGGYAALVGLTFTPEVFACAVDIVGPSNLNTLLASIPPYWGPIKSIFTTRVGDDATPEGRAFLESRSPLTFVDRIQRPLLIGQGYNDPRVKFTEAEQIVDAMQAKGIPVTYVVYPDEGHGFARPENRKSFYAISEAFLAKHLGGRAEPIGSDFEGSSVQVPTGAEDLPDVARSLSAR
jgi:dipeptidyl aminopeptidase/acylaminoacyl peptidase